jgi:hypothetical protein
MKLKNYAKIDAQRIFFMKSCLNGDCDDFAVLICSIILAVGGEDKN